MLFTPPLAFGTLIKRYKRFLADIKLEDGSTLTVHCPNTGSMHSCSTPGNPVAISRSDNPKRKYPHTLEMIKEGNFWVGVNTSLTNALVAEAIESGAINEFQNVETIKREVKVSAGSRLDLVLTSGGKTTYIEIKNCSMVEDECAMFPDAVTTRGTKHLNELMSLHKEGYGACIFFLVQRMDATSFSPATHIDPLYSETLLLAKQAGVQVLAYQADVSPTGINVVNRLTCNI